MCVGFQAAKKEYIYIYLLYIWGTSCMAGRREARSSPIDHWIVFLHFVKWVFSCFIWVVVVSGFFCYIFHIRAWHSGRHQKILGGWTYSSTFLLLLSLSRILRRYKLQQETIYSVCDSQSFRKIYFQNEQGILFLLLFSNTLSYIKLLQ